MSKGSKNAKRIQRTWLVGVIVVCLASLVVGAFSYFSFLNRSLEEQLTQNVMSVTSQQQLPAPDTGGRSKRAMTETRSRRPFPSPFTMTRAIRSSWTKTAIS